MTIPLLHSFIFPMNIHLSKINPIKLLHSKHLYSIMQKILLQEDKIKQNKEHFWTLGLTSNDQLLFIELINQGAANKALVESIEVYSQALKKRAAKIILCQNRPSGALLPSQEDRVLTDQLIQVGLLLNLPIVDHLIISNTSYLSFKDVGLIKELEQSIRSMPKYLLAQQIRTEMYELIEKRVEEIRQKNKLRVLHIARQLKKSGMEDQAVAECTNLPLEEVRALE